MTLNNLGESRCNGETDHLLWNEILGDSLDYISIVILLQSTTSWQLDYTYKMFIIKLRLNEIVVILL